MTENDYIKNSLELHLFFDRIMMKHSLFLEASFLDSNDDLKRVANEFHKIFSDVLDSVVNIADGMLSRDFLEAKEIVTNNTIDAEKMTGDFTNINIDNNITLKELCLNSGNIRISEKLLNDISDINKRALPAIENLIYFKNDVLNRVLSCKMYTTNYPLLITHIMNEAKMYYNLLSKVENREQFTDNYLYEQELFWNNIMKEHAEFIRGLLDPSEKELITTSDKFARDYEMIIANYSNNINVLTNVSLNETINFKNFKIAGEEGILNCKIKSIIIPLLADHVVREANHFIRILKNSINVR